MRVGAIFAEKALTYLAHGPTHPRLVVIVGHFKHFTLHLERQLLVRAAQLLQAVCKHARLTLVTLACLIILAERRFIFGVYLGTRGVASHMCLFQSEGESIEVIVILGRALHPVLINVRIES